jgi:hypothetical protein
MTHWNNVGFPSIPKLKFHFNIITERGKVWALPSHLDVWQFQFSKIALRILGCDKVIRGF